MLFRILLGLFLGGGRHYRGRRRHGSFGSALKGRLMLAVIVVGFGFFSYYFGSKEVKNKITGESQRISSDMTVKNEIALGLHVAPKMAAQHGGVVPTNHPRYGGLAQMVKQIGNQLVRANRLENITEYDFDFHLLADAKVVNAFALPGGQTFITMALVNRFDRNAVRDQIAGVMGHEIGHVIARHSTQQAMKSKLTSGLASAVGVLTSDGYGRGGRQLAALTNKLLSTKYGREDELESDQLGLVFMYRAGFDPAAMTRVMEILRESSGGKAPPEFLSTHPSSASRLRQIDYILKILKNSNPQTPLQELLAKVSGR